MRGYPGMPMGWRRKGRLDERSYEIESRSEAGGQSYVEDGHGDGDDKEEEANGDSAESG